MEQSPSQDELTVMHRFDRSCQLALEGEAVNYYRHMERLRGHEVNFSEMTEKKLESISGKRSLTVIHLSTSRKAGE